MRLFFAYDLRVAESDIGDTVFYSPFLSALVHYKRDNFFLVSGYVSDKGKPQKTGIMQYACGIKEFGGAEGAWRDAEDGMLSGNAIAQGSVDSVIGFSMKLEAHASDRLRLWLAAGNSLQHRWHPSGGDAADRLRCLFEETEAFAKAWTRLDLPGFDDLPSEIASLFRTSMQIVRSHMDKRGAILASTDSDIMQTARAHYAYIWPRDGALTAYAMDRLGLTGLTVPFFRSAPMRSPKARFELLEKGRGPDAQVRAGRVFGRVLAPLGRAGRRPRAADPGRRHGARRLVLRPPLPSEAGQRVLRRDVRAACPARR